MTAPLDRVDLDGFTGVYLLIGREERLTREHGAFVGEDEFRRFDSIGRLLLPPMLRSVHVMGVQAYGEVRGYFLINGRLHRRLPGYEGDWPEMDRAVATALHAEVPR